MRFRALHNPNFNLTSAQLGHPIQFQDGEYETDDLGEIKALRRHHAVEEIVEGAPAPPQKPQAVTQPDEEDEFALEEGELEEIEAEEVEEYLNGGAVRRY